MRSGNLSPYAGLALATLFDLAGTVPGWSLADLRAALWTLPGNSYGSTREWASTWAEILEYAARHSTNPSLADEIEHAFPTIIQRFAHRHTFRAPNLEADAVRAFVIRVSIQVALLRVRTNDLAGAERILVAANGPLAALAGTRTPLTAEPPRDSNRDSQLRITRVIVRGLQNKSAQDLRPPNPNHLSFDVSIFNHVVRAYAPALKKSWQRAVVAAGHPEPPISD